VIGNPIKIARIATGEEQEEVEAKPEKNEAAAELGRKGGAARAKSMSPERRSRLLGRRRKSAGKGARTACHRRLDIKTEAASSHRSGGVL
jgi:hypothetical protein